MNLEVGNGSDKKEQLSKILEQLKQEGRFQGILLSYRNGELIFSRLNEDLKHLNGSELSSMCASVLEGANNLSEVIGEASLTKVVAELNFYMLIIIQCDKNVFLTLISDCDSLVSDALDNIEKIMKKIIFLY
jgi:predicted regulator of Ras-like GTPase activity (Roadblock/LC7/MglB family)